MDPDRNCPSHPLPVVRIHALALVDETEPQPRGSCRSAGNAGQTPVEALTRQVYWRSIKPDRRLRRCRHSHIGRHRGIAGRAKAGHHAPSRCAGPHPNSQSHPPPCSRRVGRGSESHHGRPRYTLRSSPLLQPDRRRRWQREHHAAVRSARMHRLRCHSCAGKRWRWLRRLATMASIALPPSRRTARAVCEARAWGATAMPCVERIV